MAYKTLYITTIEGKTAVVTASKVRGGSLVEFRDAVTGEVRGCAGINWWTEPGHVVFYNGPLPSLPDPRRNWL